MSVAIGRVVPVVIVPIVDCRLRTHDRVGIGVFSVLAVSVVMPMMMVIWSRRDRYASATEEFFVRGAKRRVGNNQRRDRAREQQDAT